MKFKLNRESRLLWMGGLEISTIAERPHTIESKAPTHHFFRSSPMKEDSAMGEGNQRNTGDGLFAEKFHRI